mmetsp:Transcript_116279/g.370005  ORF Transcript_116279/g.370005 Transcript_116279/m.370005 type:complete len:282 (-) Transcript_116279:11-856(-)
MEGNPDMVFRPSAPPATSVAISMARLEAVLQRFEITIAQANDLVVLSDYQIVVIADDSGSMLNNALPMQMRVLGQPIRRRWDELRETLAEVVEIASCFDQNGIDIHFLNRAPITHVKSGQDAKFKQAFAQPPQGRTPLTETLQRVSKSTQGERGVLLFIFTDGEPNDGSESFKRAIRQVVSGGRVRIQIMACTADDEEIGWLNVLDEELAELDVTDDYYAEKEQVLKLGLAPKFTRGDWCMKAMLGPVSRKFDLWDEQAGRTPSVRTVMDPMAQCGGCCAM